MSKVTLQSTAHLYLTFQFQRMYHMYECLMGLCDESCLEKGTHLDEWKRYLSFRQNGGQNIDRELNFIFIVIDTGTTNKISTTVSVVIFFLACVICLHLASNAQPGPPGGGMPTASYNSSSAGLPYAPQPHQPVPPPAGGLGFAVSWYLLFSLVTRLSWQKVQMPLFKKKQKTNTLFSK